MDYSDDATPEIARRAARLSALRSGRTPALRAAPAGLGGAVLVGLSEALGPVCAVMDADLHTPRSCSRRSYAFLTGADFVVASR